MFTIISFDDNDLYKCRMSPPNPKREFKGLTKYIQATGLTTFAGLPIAAACIISDAGDATGLTPSF